MTGIAAIQAALHLGRLPEDLRIVGFDGIPEGNKLHPSLTTVCQQSAEKGRVAGRIFMRDLPDEDVLLPTQLLIRESCP